MSKEENIKNNVNNELNNQIDFKECDEERKHDKQLLQDLVFENKRKHKLED